MLTYQMAKFFTFICGVKLIERVTLGQEVNSSIPAAGSRSLLIGSVTGRDRSHGLPEQSLGRCTARKICQTPVLGPVRKIA